MRQTFTLGQTVYTKGYGGWRKAIVAEPDKTKKAFGYSTRGDRFIHYVGVQYVQPDGTVQDDRTWDVLNNRQHIITEEAFAVIQHGKQVDNRRRLMAEHEQFERDFARYAEQAEIIVKALDASADEAEDLALYLRGMFSLRGDYSRLTRGDVRKLREDNAKAATAAVEELREMGVEP